MSEREYPSQQGDSEELDRKGYRERPPVPINTQTDELENGEIGEIGEIGPPSAGGSVHSRRSGSFTYSRGGYELPYYRPRGFLKN
jgi:hypothetical protein